MVTLKDYYMGRDEQYADELTFVLRRHADVTVERVNRLLTAFGESRTVNSGWRPKAVNALTPNASKTSKHMTCEACDLEDADGDLDEFCFTVPQILTEIGLWQEHPASTKGWCHVQIVPYHTWSEGKPRWFYP